MELCWSCQYFYSLCSFCLLVNRVGVVLTAMETAVATDVAAEPAVHDQEDQASTIPANEVDGMDEERKRLLGFALQLLQEFLAAHALERTAEALRNELEPSNSHSMASLSSSPTWAAAVWFEMQHKCRAVVKTRATGFSTTLEQLLAFVVEQPAQRGNGRFALDVASSSPTPLTVCTSPMSTAFDGGASAKKKRSLQLGGSNSAGSFTLMEAYAQTRSPIVLPSQRRRHMQKTQQSDPVGEAKESNPADSGDEDRNLRADEPASAERSTAEQSGEKAEKRLVRFADTSHHQPSAPSPISKQRSSSRKKKRKQQQLKQGAAPSPVYPRSPWGNTALHVNGHFGSPAAQVHADFDAPIRRANEMTAATCLLDPEPALVRAVDAAMHRDLTAVRLVDRELRHLRREKIQSGSISAAENLVGAEPDAYERALVLERFGSTKRLECALCAFPFLLYNLPHRVSFKCVMDVHEAWGYAPPDRATAARYRPPLCYDAVRVCRMCAPIVRQYATTSALESTGSRSTESLTNRSRKPRSRGASHGALGASSFCSDPYALPPLFADDFANECDGYGRNAAGGGMHSTYAGGNGLGSSGNIPVTLESPAKAIVYANQTDVTAFMSAKEWEVINPQRSNIRQVMEKSVTGHRNSIS